MATASASFEVFNEGVNTIFGPSPKLELLLEKDWAFAHEACVFVPEQNIIWITSNQLVNRKTGKRSIKISKISLDDNGKIAACDEIPTEGDLMGNGGVNYKDGWLVCAQGSMTHPSALMHMENSPPYGTITVIDSFYGRAFNSVNDVIVHSDGSIWFTDPTYGFEQGYRPKPQLPPQLYRYDPSNGSIRAMADGFGKPNGLCFSPDEDILYVTDTHRHSGDGSQDGHRVSSIYAFDIVNYSDSLFLTNRRLFAMADNGIPDGIKCDLEGNVYSGCGDGVQVWSPGAVLLGKILVDGGAANFCFGKDGEMFLLNEKRMYKASIASHVKGALLNRPAVNA